MAVACVPCAITTFAKIAAATGAAGYIGKRISKRRRTKRRIRVSKKSIKKKQSIKKKKKPKSKTQRGGTRHKQDYEKNLGYYGPIMDKKGKLNPDELAGPFSYGASARSFCKVHDKIWDPKTNCCRPPKKKKKPKTKKKKPKSKKILKGGTVNLPHLRAWGPKAAPNIPVNIHLEGTNYKGHGNWVSSSMNSIYISYQGSKNSGRVYAPPKNYKDVEFYDKDNKVSLTWSGDWYDEDKKKYIFRNKKFTIKFPKDKDYINFKDLFHKHPQKKQKTLKNKRPSPSISATKFKVGTTKKGNDGNKWIVKENKKGVKRWVKTHKKSH